MTEETQTMQITEEFERASTRKMSIVGIGGNILLTAFKLFAGIAGHSGAMISDSIHSLSDVFATLIAYIGVRLSKKGNDQNHPYGHERFESVASLALGLILFATGLGIGKSGLEKIFSGDYASLDVPTMIALVAAIVSIVTKEAMFWYTRHYAKILNSPAFMADAWHHRSDALSSIGSLLGIGGAMIGYPVLDSVASVIISILILKVSYDVLRSSLRQMLDTSADKEFEEGIRALVEQNKEIQSIDLLKTRQFGNKVYVDIEISVDANKTITEAHEVAETLHRDVERNIPLIKHVMVHVNPAI